MESPSSLPNTEGAKPFPPADKADRPFDDWESHWDAYGGVLTGSPAKGFRYDFVLDALRQQGCGSDDMVLELGAGSGDFLAYAASKGFESLAGVEYAHTGVKVIQRRLPQAVAARYDLTETPDLTNWPAPPSRFAVCIEVLEHVDDPVLLLRNARAFLAEGARLIVTVPGGPRTNFDKHIGHRQHFTPAKIEEVCQDAGFRVISAGRRGFPFFNLYRAIIYLMGDAVQSQAKKESRAKRIFSAIFRVLFKVEVPVNLGWQTYAILEAR